MENEAFSPEDVDQLKLIIEDIIKNGAFATSDGGANAQFSINTDFKTI